MPINNLWQSKANKLWGKRAEWVSGEGQFALLAPCRVLTVTLWDTRDEAEKEKTLMDQTACGGLCTPSLHEIIDLNEWIEIMTGKLT